MSITVVLIAELWLGIKVLLEGWKVALLRYCRGWGRFGIMDLYLNDIFDFSSVVTKKSLTIVLQFEINLKSINFGILVSTYRLEMMKW